MRENNVCVWGISGQWWREMNSGGGIGAKTLFLKPNYE